MNFAEFNRWLSYRPVSMRWAKFVLFVFIPLNAFWCLVNIIKVFSYQELYSQARTLCLVLVCSYFIFMIFTLIVFKKAKGIKISSYKWIIAYHIVLLAFGILITALIRFIYLKLSVAYFGSSLGTTIFAIIGIIYFKKRRFLYEDNIETLQNKN
ncbi:hypothetical protein SDC9_60743 [bioreactor metagenome]|uniref:Uncharacterized protein n=1 Tax=bioreactor metagenome TaxID=1076179 RepID=A0A644XF38_9ZZZZ